MTTSPLTGMRTARALPAALGIVEPLYGRASFDELRRIKEDLGLVGVSFHVRFQGVTTNRYVSSLVREMEKLELFAYIHSLAVVGDEARWKVQNLAEAIPDTPIMAIDPFTTSDHSREALRVAEKTPTTHCDAN